MIDRTALTTELISHVKALVDDLQARADTDATIRESVTNEYEDAFAAGRTGHDLETWREDLLTQVAVAWVLGCVFVRFSEDNQLLGEARLSGPGERRKWAQAAQLEYNRSHPAEAERGYLLHVFTHCADVNGLAEVFGAHNPLWRFGPSDDACRDLIDLWRSREPVTGSLRWDFTDQALDTRFLGDLYQDLSEYAKKTYALLQTPDFIEKFILDRTLEPALAEFGLDGPDGSGFRMIDPACGSGHFLLGGFARLAERHHARGVGARAAAARALDSVFGVDLNPAAASIARFRLLVAALGFAGVKTLAEAPNFTINVAVGDSLLHGPPPGRLQGVLESAERQALATAHLYLTEDAETVNDILGRDYHAVVANPPYITAKDKAANIAYRQRYGTCAGKYSLAVPFMERLFDLARRGAGCTAGYVGQITTNSFMTREFGKKLVEQYLADEVELTHVIDTSGVPIPGHGTPTVILVGRNRFPLADRLRVVRGSRGEPGDPADPAEGKVWTSICELVDQPGSENDYVSVADMERGTLATHPWSLQGGAAADLKQRIEKQSARRLESIQTAIGFVGVTGTDEVFIARRRGALARQSVESSAVRDLVIGEATRDWGIANPPQVLFPYGPQGLLNVSDLPGVNRWLWPARTVLGERRTFSKQSYFEEGRPWWEWHQIALGKLKTPRLIGFASVATHNHFVFDRGGVRLYKQSAPVIKLGADATDADHLQLLGLLNSAVACFWMKQVFFNKGGTTSSSGAKGGGSEAWIDFYDFSCKKLKRFPLVSGSVLDLATALDGAAQKLAALSNDRFARSRAQIDLLRAQMVWCQEELDWRALYLYGVTDTDLSFPADAVFELHKGERAFEIALARGIEAGHTESAWFQGHGSTPLTEPPTHWPDWYQARVQQRLELIESNRLVNLAERPEYKRRWAWPSVDTLTADAQRYWLLQRLEADHLWTACQVRTVANLAHELSQNDPEFVQIAQLYRGEPHVDLVKLVAELVDSEAAPYLAAWRYKEPGMRKRAAWQRTWAQQRRHDAGEDKAKVPVPPSYQPADFHSAVVWDLRGKLDVSNEAFISYPGAQGAVDDTPVVGWAGWDHLQQAKALAALLSQREQTEGRDSPRLTPLLAGLAELVPWLQQWHNEYDPNLGMGLGDYYASFLTAETQRHGLAAADLTAWRPPKQAKGRKKRATP